MRRRDDMHTFIEIPFQTFSEKHLEFQACSTSTSECSKSKTSVAFLENLEVGCSDVTGIVVMRKESRFHGNTLVH